MTTAPAMRNKGLPLKAIGKGRRFEITAIDGHVVSGIYQNDLGHNRFEVHVRYEDGSAAWFSVLADLAYVGRSPELTGKSCAFRFEISQPFDTIGLHFKEAPELDFSFDRKLARVDHKAQPKAGLHAVILFDVSDLVYYIGHHDNLTGIQRVQACVLLGLLNGHPEQRREYVSYDNGIGDFNVIERRFFEDLLVDLSRPVADRKVHFDKMEACRGILPNSYPLAGIGRAADERLIIYLLGAAWVNRDYFHRILDLKRVYDAQFCITIHDLIPIYARETCDQGTAIVFEEFLRKSFLFTDHYFTVSAYTAYDLHRFAATVGITHLPVSVIENGHSFDEFLPSSRKGVSGTDRDIKRLGKAGFVLFVSTIEGRKNHSYIFDVWQELSRTRPNLPVLVCVGRFGWRAESFLEKMLMTGNLGNKIRVLSEVSDAQLEALYENCLFTVYPSLYEGWGLPAGEALSKGKLCAMSDRSSLPEVAGEFGVYFDVDQVSDGVAKIAELIDNPAHRLELEAAVSQRFKARTWTRVADELVAYIAQLPPPRSSAFPLLALGQEYKVSQLPPRNISALGAAMISQVEGARRAPLTGRINRDDDLLCAQASRLGPGWYSPEDWGTWSRFPDCMRLYYVRPAPEAREAIIYERVRVVGALVGSTLAVSLNDGPAGEYKIEHDRFLIRASGPLEVAADGTAELQLTYRLTAPGDVTKVLDEIDGRRLGLGIESTLVLQDSDLPGRLRVMELIVAGGTTRRGPVRPVAEVRPPAGRRWKAPKLPETTPTMETALPFEGFGSERSLDAPKIELGEVVMIGRETLLQSEVATAALLGRGWYPVESEAVWSNSIEATINLRLPAEADRVFMLGVEFRCLASAEQPATLSVAINDTLAWSDTVRASGFQTRRFIVDAAVSPYDNAFVLCFFCDRLMSPSQVGQGDDHRLLGVQLRSLWAEAMPTMPLRAAQSVTRGSVGERALVNGWYPVEIEGAWSVADGGRIVCAIEVPVDDEQRAVRLAIFARVFGTAMTGPASVDLLVQGQVVTSWRFEDDAARRQTAILPILTVGDRRIVDVTLVRQDAVSPADVGGGDDRRRLGVLAYEIEVETVALEQAAEAVEAGGA